MSSASRRVLLAVAAVVAAIALAEGRLVERFTWNELQFDWPSPQAREAALASEQVNNTNKVGESTLCTFFKNLFSCPLRGRCSMCPNIICRLA